MAERYGPYAGTSPDAGPGLTVRLGLEERDYFIDPPEAPALNPVLLACDGERVRYLGYRVAGWFACCPRPRESLFSKLRVHVRLNRTSSEIRLPSGI